MVEHRVLLREGFTDVKNEGQRLQQWGSDGTDRRGSDIHAGWGAMIVAGRMNERCCRVGKELGQQDGGITGATEQCGFWCRLRDDDGGGD